MSGILEECLSEKAFLAEPQARREEFALIKLAEDALLCEFTPWFRGLSWESYRQYCPRLYHSSSLSMLIVIFCKEISQFQEEQQPREFHRFFLLLSVLKVNMQLINLRLASHMFCINRS